MAMDTTEGRSKAIFGAIALVVGVVILIAIAALIVGSILASTVFTDIDIINVTELTDGFSAFVLGIITFLGIIGIIIGIVWLISYLKPLFSKDEGIQSFAGSWVLKVNNKD